MAADAPFHAEIGSERGPTQQVGTQGNGIGSGFGLPTGRFFGGKALTFGFGSFTLRFGLLCLLLCQPLRLFPTGGGFLFRTQGGSPTFSFGSLTGFRTVGLHLFNIGFHLFGGLGSGNPPHLLYSGGKDHHYHVAQAVVVGGRYQTVGNEHPFRKLRAGNQLRFNAAVAQVAHAPCACLSVFRSRVTAHRDIHLPRPQAIDIPGENSAQAVHFRTIALIGDVEHVLLGYKTKHVDTVCGCRFVHTALCRHGQQRQDEKRQ